MNVAGLVLAIASLVTPTMYLRGGRAAPEAPAATSPRARPPVKAFVGAGPAPALAPPVLALPVEDLSEVALAIDELFAQPPVEDLGRPRTVVGFVRSVETDEPLEGVTVIASHREQNGFVAITDEEGRYEIELPAEGSWGVTAYYVDYTGEELGIAIHADRATAHDIYIDERLVNVRPGCGFTFAE